MTGDDLPVVLRHRHRHDLIRAGEERSNGCGDVFRAPSSSAKVSDSPVWGICKAVRWGTSRRSD